MADSENGHTRPQLFSGARGVLYINNVAHAFVTDVSVQISANVRPVHTFGAATARSVEPLSTGVSVSLGRVYPVNAADGTAIDTSDIAVGIEPVISQMLLAEDIMVELRDRITGATVAKINHCRFAGRSLSVAAQQIAQERIQLVGIFDGAGGNTSDNVGL